jgi:hypothetical protein
MFNIIHLTILVVTVKGDSNPPPPLTGQHAETIFLAYDCSAPQQLIDTGYTSMDNCRPVAKVQNTIEDITYQVLQQEKHLRRTGHTCKMIKSRNAYYCGTYDHQTKLTHQSYEGLPVPVSLQDCENLISKHRYTDPAGTEHPIDFNTVNLIKYEELGRTYVSDKEVSCEGEDWKVGNILLSRMIVEIQIKIIVTEEKFLMNHEEVVAHKDNVRTVCTQQDKGCVTPTATYIWGATSDYCSLALTRISRGAEARNRDGDTVFMSTDGSLIRLLKREAVMMCDRRVFRTNYPGIFMYPATEERLITRKVDPGEVSISTYVNNRDDFLYNHLKQEVEREFQSVIKADCREQSRQSKLQFWLQHSDPGLTTWFMGNGTFATTAGEVIYQYQCRPVHVRALNDQQCYRGLPVEMLPESIIDTRRVDIRPLFMEPLTHRLSHQAVVVPCSRTFVAKYQNAVGTWLMATPELHRSNDPLSPPDLEARRTTFGKEINWAQGGLYTLDQMAAMEEYQDFGRTVDALNSKLANQASRYLTPGPVHPRQLFPGFDDPSMWFTGVYAKVLGFLHAWGEGASIFMSIYIIYRLIYSLIQWIYGAVIIRDIYGCSKQLFWVPCFKMLLLRQHRRNYRQYNETRDLFRASRDETSGTQYEDLEAKRGLPAKEEPTSSVATAPPRSSLYPEVPRRGQQWVPLKLLPGQTNVKP